MGPVEMSFEQLTEPSYCPDCGSGPQRPARSRICLLLLGAAAYIPVMGLIFVELFGVEPDKLIVARSSHSEATTATLVFFVGAIGWLVFWWRYWRGKLATLVPA